MEGQYFYWIKELNIESFLKGQISEVWLYIINNGIGELVWIFIIIVWGKEDGLVFGLNVVLYGNELNGILVI